MSLASVAVNDGTPVPYLYDRDGLLTKAGDLTVNHAATNGLIQGTSLGSAATSLGYDSFGDLASLTGTYSGNSLFSETLTRDNLGRIKTKQEGLGSDQHSYAYVYDSAGRLTDVTRDGQQLRHYDYDANSNRTAITDSSGTTTADYNAQDQLTRYGGTTYTYTRNGELHSATASGGDATTYSYDGLGDLKGVDLPDGRHVSYVLDGQGRRVAKKVDDSVVASYMYDGDALVAELAADGSVKSRFIYGPDGQTPSYMVRDGNTYRIFSDDLGSPRLVVDTGTGDVAQQLSYDEFGNVTSDSNPGFQPFGYAGGLYDQDTGLVHFGAREYDPHTGRFTSKDPLGFGAGDTNVYGYVFSDPVNAVDPSGMSIISALKDFGGRAAAGVAGEASALSGGLTDHISHAFDWYPECGEYGDSYQIGHFAGNSAVVVGMVGLGGEGAAVEAGEEGFEGVARTYLDITNRGSIRNIGTDATHTEFIETLTNEGWTSSFTKDGEAQLFQKDGAKYVLRARASSHAGWTADFTPAGSPGTPLKIRLGYSP